MNKAAIIRFEAVAIIIIIIIIMIIINFAYSF